MSPSAAIRPAPLIWDPDLEEADDEPPYLILHNEYFTVYKHRRQKLLSGEPPAALKGQRGISARAWRAYQHRMRQEPPWERAERYQQMIAQQGFRSIRAFARATGEDYSRIAKIFKVLELPPSALEALRRNADNAGLRTRFTERRLRQLVRENRGEAVILHEIEQVIQGRAGDPARVHPDQRSRSDPFCRPSRLTASQSSSKRHKLLLQPTINLDCPEMTTKATIQSTTACSLR